MKTYAATKGFKPFNWNKALADAIKKEPSAVRRERMAVLASNWPTCACGNQCAVIPRSPESGAPYDGGLFSLGVDFCGAVDKGRWREAQRIMAKIEARSARILKSITRQPIAA